MFPSKKSSTALLAVVFLLTWISPKWPWEQLLHSSLTFVALIFLWRYARHHTISNQDYFLIMLFLTIHTFGARWLYSYVPYDTWVQSTMGFTLHEYFGWTRNHYDRFVHLMYGICFTPVLLSHLQHTYKLNTKNGFIIALMLIIVSSVIYEWFEWIIAITLSSHNAEAYNGQQGDMWDAHKDMLLATVGSLLWGLQSVKKESEEF